MLAESARFDPPGHLGVHWVEVRAGLRVARGHASAGDLVARAVSFLSRPYVDPQIRLPLHMLGMEAALAAGGPGGGDPGRAGRPRRR